MTIDLSSSVMFTQLVTVNMRGGMFVTVMKLTRRNKMASVFGMYFPSSSYGAA